MDDTITAFGAAILGGVIGGSLQGIPTFLVPGRQAKLEREAWLRSERRVLYGRMAIAATRTATWIEDFQNNLGEDPVVLQYFNDHRRIYTPEPSERLEITADLRVVGTPTLRGRWAAYDAEAERLRIAMIWATEDEGAGVERVIPDLAEATANLLNVLTDALSTAQESAEKTSARRRRPVK